MRFEIRFRVDANWRLKDYYQYEVRVKGKGLYGVYRWYVSWLCEQDNRPRGVNIALIDYLVIDGVKIVDGNIFRMNAQTFRKVERPIVDAAN